MIVILLGEAGNEKRSDVSESYQVRDGATVVFSNLENEKRSDVSGSDQVSSGSNTVLVNPEGNAKRSGVSVGNQVE